MNTTPSSQIKKADELVVHPPPDPWLIRPFKRIPKQVWTFLLVGFFLLINILVAREIQNPQIFKLKANQNKITISVQPANTILDGDTPYQLWMTADQPVAFMNIALSFDPNIIRLTENIKLANASLLKLVKATTLDEANKTGKIILTTGFEPPVFGNIQGSYYEWYRQYGSETHHTGVDFGVPCGTIVKASADGTVVLAKDQWGFFGGSSVFIDHGPSVGDEHVYTFYTHLSSLAVVPGQQVKKGDVLGFVGYAGTGCHLHWGISNKPPELFINDEEHAQDQPDHLGWINPENPPKGTYEIAELHFAPNTQNQEKTTHISFTIPDLQITGLDNFPFGAVLKQATILVNPIPTPLPISLMPTPTLQESSSSAQEIASSFSTVPEPSATPTPSCAPVNGTIQYTPWTPCSKLCGGGVQTRIAECIDASCGGVCPEDAVVTQVCNEQDCQTTITIVAAGTSCEGVYPTMQLLIDNEVVSTWNNVQGNPYLRQFSHYVYQTDRSVMPNQIRVQFVNDCHKSLLEDRNLRVDKIMINSVSYETEDIDTYSTGTLDSQGGCKPGIRESEWLHCTGYFQY